MGAYFYSYLNTAQTILSSYKFEQPFHVHLKSFFKRNKKYGSRDRKIISNLCFGFFRIGDAANNLSFQDQVIIGYFLSHEFDNGFLATLQPGWVDKIQDVIDHKLNVVQLTYPTFNQQLLFPGVEFLTDGIAPTAILHHHFYQPDFFIRVRPDKRKLVEKKLVQHNIPFKAFGESALKLSSGTDLHSIVEIDKEAVVQDISSQSTFEYFPNFGDGTIHVWDACAGSGGKSIMTVDHYKKVKLHVSDIREDILDELSRRFTAASIQPESLFCTDLQQSLSKQVVDAHLPTEGVDLIIADVPCTGSGTWGRSPEWLKGFDLELIGEYQNRQKKIIANLPHHLKQEGFLLYITCSVYRQENEEVTDFLKSRSGLSLIKQGVLHQDGGDYLFAALFKKEA
jgi:16S rRNA (cytosine967-C5)-methyltransferase